MTRGQEAALRQSLASAKAAHTGAENFVALVSEPVARRRAERMRLTLWRAVETVQEELRQQIAAEFVSLRVAENAAEVGR